VDAGIKYVILGHSERRTLFGESSEFIAQKTKAAVKAGLTVIFCVGETLQERESGKTTDVVDEQTAAAVKELDEADWRYAGSSLPASELMPSIITARS